MIIGKKFVWTHIPRTGGDVTAELFKFANRLLKGRLIETANSLTVHSKHDTFERKKIDSNKKSVLNIRRLPSFIMSWIIMCAGRLNIKDKKCFKGGIWPEYNQPLPIPSKKQLFNTKESYGSDYFHKYYGGNFATLPDYLLKQYIDGYFISHWIRIEDLKEDFLKFIVSAEKVNGQQIEAIKQYQFTTKKPFNYNHTIEDFFSIGELQTLYSNNPLWQNIENRLYQEDK